MIIGNKLIAVGKYTQQAVHIKASLVFTIGQWPFYNGLQKDKFHKVKHKKWRIFRQAIKA